MKVYVSGAMTGIKDLNRMAFDKVKFSLEQQGHTVVLPHDVPATKAKMGYDDWMKADVAMMVTCEVVHMMKGWLNSPGATKEWQIANLLNMTVTYEE